MTLDYFVGGLSHNMFDIDADGLYLFLAALNSTFKPCIIKMKADLSADGVLAYNPGAGSEVNLMAGDLSGYWLWAAGDFGGTDKVIWTGDRGNYWYVQNEITWVGTARPILVGPGDDSLLTTSTDLTFWQNRYEGDVQYWIERYIPGTIWAVDRVDVNFEQAVIGGYWYSGDSPLLTYYSPNSGLDWKNVTDALPQASITSLIIGQ